MSKFTPDAHKFISCERELKKDEIWVGNTNVTKGFDLPPHLKQLKTARFGEQAYYITGEPIPRDYCRPFIIHKSEAKLYDDIMVARSKASRYGTL